MIYRLLVASLAVASLAESAVIESSAWAAPRNCFTSSEMDAEVLVREGIRLREGAVGCSERPWNYPTLALWVQIKKDLGPQFLQQTQTRQAAYQREFADAPSERLGEWNGRIVTYYRNYPLSAEYCTGMLNTLKSVQKGGWTVFTKDAKKATDVFRMLYAVCGGTGGAGAQGAAAGGAAP